MQKPAKFEYQSLSQRSGKIRYCDISWQAGVQSLIKLRSKIMRILLISVFSLLFLVLSCCDKKVNIEAEKAAILKILADDDQDLLDGTLRESDGSSINIMEGNLEKLTHSEANRRNKTLFARGKFIKVENLDGPIINISPDGNMAWVAVKTKFTIAYTDSLGADKEWEGIEARLEVYEKRENSWDAVVCAQTH